MNENTRPRLVSRLKSLDAAHDNATVNVALDGQWAVCHICEGTNGEWRGLCLDHDHASGAVRGWLCDSCNRAVGGFRDDPHLLFAAALYLVRANAVNHYVDSLS